MVKTVFYSPPASYNSCLEDFTNYPLTGPVHSLAISTPWGAYSTAAIEGADH